MLYSFEDITANQALLVLAGYAAMLATHEKSDFEPIELHQETFRKSVETLKFYNGTIKEIHDGIKCALVQLSQYESFVPGISDILQNTTS